MNVQLKRMKDTMQLLKQMRSITKANQKGKQDRILHLKQMRYNTNVNQNKGQEKIHLFQLNEARYQRISKQNAKKRPFVLECERTSKQQKRQQSQKSKEDSELNKKKAK